MEKPLDFQRIITGQDSVGKAVFLDRLARPQLLDFTHVPGFAVSTLWATGSPPRLPEAVTDPVPAVASLVPAPGETRCVKVTFPPDSVLQGITDWAAAGAEYAAKLPGLAETFEADSPGMHTTPSIDYVVLLSGELWLELDAGEERRLRAGDVVVQNGTRHAWRNRSAQPATILSVMIGATRSGG